VGVTEPEATFSACFGAPFLVWHPTKYAELLAAKMREQNVDVWLVNTGWTGGPYGEGHRMSIKHTRAIIDAIHDGSLKDAKTTEDPIFGLAIPTTCPNVPDEVLVPKNTWKDPSKYDATAKKLAGLFHENFKKYADQASQAILKAGPRV
jgi:phosphoenolpyruvate carboxykinase (ATP)